jgi:hypothetical protein
VLEHAFPILTACGTFAAGNGVVATGTFPLQGAANWQTLLLSGAAVYVVPGRGNVKRSPQDTRWLRFAAYFGYFLFLLLRANSLHLCFPLICSLLAVFTNEP